MKTELAKIRKVYDDCAKEGCQESKMFERIQKPDTVNRTIHRKITATEYLKIMDENFGSCTNPGNPYTKVKTWLETGELPQDCGTAHDILENIERV